jgi:hypothetical protein
MMLELNLSEEELREILEQLKWREEEEETE